MHLSPTGAEQSQQKRAFLCSACQEWIFPGLSVLHDDASHILRPGPFLAITVTPLPWLSWTFRCPSPRFGKGLELQAGKVPPEGGRTLGEELLREPSFHIPHL